MGFRFIDHTADICVQCRAQDFAGLLQVAAQALYEVALDEVRNGAEVERQLEVRGTDREETLVRWLQEILFLLDVEHFVTAEFGFGKVTSTEVHATLRGYVHEPEERATEVKAATYHEMKIEEQGGHLVGTVVFDL